MSFLYRYAADEAETVRGIDEDKRTATFVASTERAVPMGWGPPEVLRMSGCDLKRFKSNPVVLNAHNRYSVEAIIGTAKVEKVGRELHATITFDPTPEGEAAWLRVKSGSLRAVSVGYSVDSTKIKRLAEGETDGAGDGLVSGPASVVRGWQLMEISVVPVPADQDALLRRSVYAAGSSRGGIGMALDLSSITPPAPPPSVNPPASGQPVSAPAVHVAADARDLPEEIAMRKRAAINEQIRGLAPASVNDVAEECILEGLDVEAARAKVRAAYAARRAAPIGTPEPAPAAGSQNNSAPELTADTVLRAITGLRS
jgi:hypothetical protein